MLPVWCSSVPAQCCSTYSLRFGITVASVHNCKLSEEVWSLTNADRNAIHMPGTYIFRILIASVVAIIVHVAGHLTVASAFLDTHRCEQAVSCLFPGQGGSRGGPGEARSQREARGP